MSWLISRALVQAFTECESLPSSLGPEAEFWAGIFSDGGLSSLSSGSPIQLAFLPPDRMTAFSDPSLSGMTFEPLTVGLGAAVLTWCLEDSLAKTSVVPAKVPDSLVRAPDYGRTWHELSVRWSRNWSMWKTARSSLLEDSMKFLPTLPRWGSMRDGALWERRTLARRINETDAGFLPTPVKYDATGTWESNNNWGLGWFAKHVWVNDPTAKHRNKSMAEKTFKPENERSKEVIEAARAAEQKRTARARVRTLFPTPIANDGQKRGNFDVNHPRNGLPAAVRKEQIRVRVHVETFPTPIRSDATVSKTGYVLNSVENGKAFNQLARQIEKDQRIAAGDWPPKETFPTPLRNDSTSGSDAAGREGGPSLKQRIRTIGTPTAQNGLRGGSNSDHRPRMWGTPDDPDYGELNPDWVEWLMDWPYGWTSLEPMQEFEGWLAKAAGPWEFDPSMDGAIPRTCAKSTPARVERIAAIGNGQVSAVAAAAFLHLYSLSFDDIPRDKFNLED